jgi:hypothetical protein
MKFRCFIETTGLKTANVRLGTPKNPGALSVPITFANEVDQHREFLKATKVLHRRFSQAVKDGYSPRFMLTEK